MRELISKIMIVSGLTLAGFNVVGNIVWMGVDRVANPKLSPTTIGEMLALAVWLLFAGCIYLVWRLDLKATLGGDHVR